MNSSQNNMTMPFAAIPNRPAKSCNRKLLKLFTLLPLFLAACAPAQWQYQTFYWPDEAEGPVQVRLIRHGKESEDSSQIFGVSSALDAMGREGWEAFHMERAESGKTYFLKRPRQADRTYWTVTVVPLRPTR